VKYIFTGFFISLSLVLFLFAPKNIFASGHVFSDSSYSVSTNKFSAGQTVYVKVQASSSSNEKILRLLDSNKNQIKQIEMIQNSNIYTASFNAPKGDGIYYLDIRISDGAGSVFASQENINVGGGGSSATASVNTVINSSTNRIEVNSDDVSVRVEGEGKVSVNGDQYSSNNTPRSSTLSQEPTPTLIVENDLPDEVITSPSALENKNIFQQINNFFSDLVLKLTNLF